MASFFSSPKTIQPTPNKPPKVFNVYLPIFRIHYVNPINVFAVTAAIHTKMMLWRRKLRQRLWINFWFSIKRVRRILFFLVARLFSKHILEHRINADEHTIYKSWFCSRDIHTHITDVVNFLSSTFPLEPKIQKIKKNKKKIQEKTLSWYLNLAASVTTMFYACWVYVYYIVYRMKRRRFLFKNNWLIFLHTKIIQFSFPLQQHENRVLLDNDIKWFKFYVTRVAMDIRCRISITRAILIGKLNFIF